MIVFLLGLLIIALISKAAHTYLSPYSLLVFSHVRSYKGPARVLSRKFDDKAGLYIYSVKARRKGFYSFYSLKEARPGQEIYVDIIEDNYFRCKSVFGFKIKERNKFKHPVMEVYSIEMLNRTYKHVVGRV